MSTESHYWYNLSTNKVEYGLESASINRAGPFKTAEEAAQAPEIIAARSRQWAEDDENDD